MATERKHALLSPSSAHRWLHCTPSAVAESKVEDRGSRYALEGTLAHAVAERELLKMFSRDASRAEEEIRQIRVPITGEMMEAVRRYANFVANLYTEERAKFPVGTTELHVELPLDLGAYAPGSFGTADAVIVSPRNLMIFDFKYGQGVEVKAAGNPQMRLYALGALDEFGLERDIRTVTDFICQPRRECLVNAESMTAEELLEWGFDYVRPLADVAYRGIGERVCGYWCKFCKVAPMCDRLNPEKAAQRARDAARFIRHKTTAESVSDFDGITLTDE